MESEAYIAQPGIIGGAHPLAWDQQHVAFGLDVKSVVCIPRHGIVGILHSLACDMCHVSLRVGSAICVHWCVINVIRPLALACICLHASACV